MNQPPTLNVLSNLTVNENAGQQTVKLSGITSGTSHEVQTLTVNAASSNPGPIPNPTVNYTSPNTTGSLSFTPVPYATGASIITVNVDDGAANNNLVSRTFTVSVRYYNDTTRHTDQISAPTSNQQLTNGTFTVTGKANDNVAVGMVYYSLNGSGWTAATTGNNWTNWTAPVMLKPGTNTVRVYAVDTSGNISPTNSGAVNLIVPPAASATLAAAAYGDGGYTFVVSGAAGYKYLVQASTDLVNWVSLQTNTAPFTFVDTNASQFDQRFYRTIFNP